jgi:hypothetical protein
MKLLSKMLALGVASLLATSVAHAQDYVLELNDGSSLGSYTLGGVAINSALIPTSGLNNPQFMTTIGDDLYISQEGNGQVAEYSIGAGGATATLITSSLLASPLGSAYGMATDGTNLFIAEAFSDKVVEVNATTGATVNANFASFGNLAVGEVMAGGNLYIAVLDGNVYEYNTSGTQLNVFSNGSNPFGITSNGTDLFVNSQVSNTVNEFTLGGTFVTTLVAATDPNPQGMWVNGTTLYVASWGANTIKEYSTVNGNLLGTFLSPGPDGHIVDVSVVPEPSTWAMLLGGLGLLAFCVRMRRMV